MIDMISSLPTYERTSDVMKNLYVPIEEEIERLKGELSDIRKQENTDTATWGIELQEEELALKANGSLDLETRRKIVKAKIKSQPPSSKKQMQQVIQSFVEDSQIKEYFEDFSFEILLKTTEGVAEELPHIEKIVEEFKPAHLSFIFNVCYLEFLNISINFLKFNTEKFKKSGTLDVSGTARETTAGIKRNCYFKYGQKTFLVKQNINVSKITFLENFGKKTKHKAKCDTSKYLCREALIISRGQNIYTQGIFLKHKSIGTFNLAKGEEIKRCSQEDLGAFFKQKIYNKIKKYECTKFQICGISTTKEAA